MIQPPTYYTWKIDCCSPVEAQTLHRWLSSRIDLDRIWTDSVHVYPHGVEEVTTVPHRFGDYFEAIDMLQNSEADPASFRIVFQKWLNAGRFWKDLRVNILREIETTYPNASIRLESKGEREPVSV